MEKKKQIDMTQGAIAKPMFVFILPLIAGSLFQQLYNTVDFIYVGNFMNETAAAAVGASSSLINCLVVFFSGASVGASIVISQRIGAHKSDETDSALHTAVSFGLIFGCFLMIIGLIFCIPILKALNTPDSVIAEASLYMRVYMISLPFSFTYNMLTGAMRAWGDSKTPFNILAVCGFLNVLMDALFIIVIPMGVLGVAIATLISQGASCVMAVIASRKQGNPVVFSIKKLCIKWELLKQILYIGLPAGIQSVIITFSNMMVQYHINAYGETAIAGFTSYYKVENLIYIPIMAIGQAATTFCGQNAGAKNYKRIQNGRYVILGIGVAITLCISGLILLFPNQVFGFFINSPDVVEIGISLAKISFPFYWIYVFLEVFGGSVRALGYSISSMIVTIANICVLRVALLGIIDDTFHTVRSLAVVYPVTWGTSALCFFIMSAILVRKKIKSNIL